MNPFKTYSFKWWQISIFKLALLAGGIAVGAYWYEFWDGYLTALVVVAVVSGAYIIYFSLKHAIKS